MSENPSAPVSAPAYTPEPVYPTEPETLGTPVTQTGTQTGIPTGTQTGTQTGTESTSTQDVAKEQAANVGQRAAGAGQRVAGVTKDEAQNVAGEAANQAKNLLGQTRTELQDQAAAQQQRLASGIRSLGGELGTMAERSEQSGTATDLIRQASQRADDLAGWLEARDPGALVQEVTSFARRRPGAFLAIAVGAGLVAGRLTRGAIDAARDDSPDVPQARRSTNGTTNGTTGRTYPARSGFDTGYDTGYDTPVYDSPTSSQPTTSGQPTVTTGTTATGYSTQTPVQGAGPYSVTDPEGEFRE